MKSIVLIIPFFGKWPIWFDAHLLSIKENKSINWLFITDCEIPSNYPQNSRFVKKTIPEITIEINKKVGANVPLFPVKFCDLKPAYGDIFQEYIVDYDFWGFCDLDIIWGNIRKFITDAMLSQYDIISSRKNAISGHFNLFKNTNAINLLYKKIENYKFLFEQPKFMWFDELVFDEYIKDRIASNNFEFKVYWDKILLNHERGIDSHQEYHLDKWIWSNGEIYSTKEKNEIMYLHFINWKKTIKKSQVNYTASPPKSFYISYSMIHLEKHSILETEINKIKNIFVGYYVQDYIRIQKNNLKKIGKKIRVKFKKIIHFKF